MATWRLVHAGFAKALGDLLDRVFGARTTDRDRKRSSGDSSANQRKLDACIARGAFG
jgi:hypothetical protein